MDPCRGAMTPRIDICGNIAQAGATQVNNVNYAKMYTTEDIDRFCLRALGCSDSLVVKSRLKETKDKLLPQSIEWILQDLHFKRWQTGHDVCLLWIKGGAGKGKTMMSIGIIEELSRTRCESTVVTYFFCQNADRELNTLGAIIKGLILQLINQKTTLTESLRRRWDTTNDRFDEDIASWRALWDILLEMLDRCNCSRIYLIVDALDECQEGGMTNFLKLIVRTGLNQPTKIKWLLTSRPLDSAERELLAGHDQVQVSLELNSKHVSSAVKIYITEKVKELDRRARYGDKLKQEIEIELINKAENTFLWVGLVCKELECVSSDEAFNTIRSLPLGLHLLYDRILNQLSEGDLADVQRCMRLLKVMILAYRPFKVEEIPSVTGLADEQDTIQATLNRCASFIRVQGNNIDFVHQSARDYLAGENGQKLLNMHEHFGHDRIVLACISHLSKRLKVNLMELPRPDSCWKTLMIPNAERQLRTTLLDSLGYAATFWVQHFKEVKCAVIAQKVLDEQDEVSNFLRLHLLKWLECLSLLNMMRLALEALKTLADIVKDNPSESAFIMDATQFLCRNSGILDQFPLQIYSSGVIFSPELSVVRKRELEKIPWLKRVSPMGDTWPSLIPAIYHLQTFTNTLCDPILKQLEPALPGHSGVVTGVVFSPDGKQIASYSDDKTIKLWDSTTGHQQSTLSGHSGIFKGVVFSPDGKQILSSSYDNTIKLWDSTTGRLQSTLPGHSGIFKGVVFSPDGKQVASPHNKTVKLWDSTTGNLQSTLSGHLGMVSVVFSPDSKQIASSSDDESIKLWNSTTGQLQSTLSGHSGVITGVVFSPDGKQIASSSDDESIELWDSTTGHLQTTLSSHLGQINAMAFSHDGKQLAFSSDDKNIKLLDITKSLQAPKFIPHILRHLFIPELFQEIETSEKVHMIQFSGGGRYLQTNIGLIKLESTLSHWHDTNLESLKHLDVFQSWVYYGETPFLYLPSGFNATCYDVHGDQVAIGLGNGGVLSLNIDRKVLQSMLECNSSMII